jgi:MFS family permease
MEDSYPAPRPFTLTEWLICVVSAIGFAFDIYALLVAPLVIPPALSKMGHLQLGSKPFLDWAGLMFWIPALAGGVFGLIGGYLTDLFGRRRVLVWSILLYAFSALAAGFATSLPQLLFFRCTTFVGVCVEFVAGVAWLAELFPNPKQRESVLGYTQAFSSVGGLLVTAGYFLAVTFATSLPAVHGEHEAWRYTLISGVLPAIPLIFIRPFLPESPTWQAKKLAGTLQRPSIAALFQAQYRQTTLVTTLIFACSYGAAFGAIQQVPQIVPGLPGVSNLPNDRARQQVVSQVQGFQEAGGLVGRVALAYLAVRIVSRRKLLRIFQVPGLIVMPFVFFYAAVTDVGLLKWGIALAGFLTVAQFSYWGNYLPRVYPVHLRGTGESFAANIGGRMIGTGAAFVTTQLAQVIPVATRSHRVAYAAGCVALAVYLIGFAASFRLPEPPEKLPD